MAEKEKIIKNTVIGFKALAVGVPGVYGAKDVYHAGSTYFGAKHDLDAIHDATADFGKATGDLVFQVPEAPSVRGVTFYEGSKLPAPSNAVGTAEHGRYELLKAGLVPEADRAQAIVRRIESEIKAHPTSDFAAQRQELHQLATALNPHVARLEKVKNDQYFPALKGSAIALMVPIIWIGVKKWIERRRLKNDPSVEPKRGIISKLTELPTQKEEPGENKQEAVSHEDRDSGVLGSFEEHLAGKSRH